MHITLKQLNPNYLIAINILNSGYN